MAKFYHVNPSNGEVSRCRALLHPCPFGGRLEHYDTADDAAKAYEKVMTRQTWAAINKTVENASRKPEQTTLASILKLFPTTDHEKNLRDGESFRSGRKEKFRSAYRSCPLGQRLALDVYSLEDHARNINKLLMAPDGRELVRRSEYEDTVRNLDQFLEDNRRVESEFTYRGVPLGSRLERKAVLAALNTLKVGDNLTFDGYVSSSTSLANAIDFNDGPGGLIYEIYSSSGSFINETVEEVLLPRGRTFTFGGIEECSQIYDYTSVKLIERELLP